MTEVDDIREEEVLAKVEEKLKAEKAPKEYTKNGYIMVSLCEIVDNEISSVL